MIDTTVAVLIVVCRIACLLTYGMLLVKSLFSLVNTEGKEQRGVYLFITMLTTAIAYASFTSVYNWLLIIQTGDMPDNTSSQLNALVIAFLYVVPGIYGSWIFKAWRY